MPGLGVEARTLAIYAVVFAGLTPVLILAGLPRTPAIETFTPACAARSLILVMASLICVMASCLRRSVLVLISSCAQVITCERSASGSAFTVSCVILFLLR